MSEDRVNDDHANAGAANGGNSAAKGGTEIIDDKSHVRHKLDFSDAEWITSTDDEDEPGVEVAFVDGYIGMRNGADPDGPVLVFTPEEWDAFVEGAKEGEFDEP